MYFNFNGLLVNDLKQLPVLNRSFRYGDGFFESILWYEGRMPLWHYHRDRMRESIAYIFSAAALLPDFDSLSQKIRDLVAANRHQHARIRITFWRRGGGTYRALENAYDYLIEAGPLEVQPLSRLDVIRYGYCPDIQKPMIRLSNFKTNSSLYYVMAQQYARLHDYQEVLLLNTENRVCEGSYQNIFILKEGIFYTPPLSEGCIDGSSRRFLIDLLQQHKYRFEETSLSKQDIDQSDALFFTNGILIMTPGRYDEAGRLMQLIRLVKNSLNLEGISGAE